MATAAHLRALLAPTSVPAALLDELLRTAGTAWLMGTADEVVAAEAVLCHPPLIDCEVRAVANPTEAPGTFRVTIVAADRPGLLAATAGALASEDVTVLDAVVTILPDSRLALQRVAVAAAGDTVLDDRQWEDLGRRLRQVLGGDEAVASTWTPSSPVAVEVQPQETGRTLVTVQAPDQVGLLHATASWFFDHDCNIEACHASSDQGTATDIFVVAGHVDAPGLTRALGGGGAEEGHGGWFAVRQATGPVRLVVRPLRLVVRPARLVAGVARGGTLLPWRVGVAVGRAVLRRR